jgi:hypothetical protein
MVPILLMANTCSGQKFVLEIEMKVDKTNIERFIREKVEVEALTDAQIARLLNVGPPQFRIGAINSTSNQQINLKGNLKKNMDLMRLNVLT